jgi:transposase
MVRTKLGMQALGVDLRKRVVAAKERGEASEAVARRFGVCKSSVDRWLKRHRETGDVGPWKQGGYRGSLLEGRDDTIRQWIKKEPDATLRELQERCLEELGIKISIGALWKRIEGLGLSFKKNATRRRARAARR